MINLHYVRAAIEADTGVRLTLERTRDLLVEEGLITQQQADRDARLFRSYAEFFDLDVAEGSAEALDTDEGLPS